MHATHEYALTERSTREHSSFKLKSDVRETLLKPLAHGTNVVNVFNELTAHKCSLPQKPHLTYWLASSQISLTLKRQHQRAKPSGIRFECNWCLYYMYSYTYTHIRIHIPARYKYVCTH